MVEAVTWTLDMRIASPGELIDRHFRDDCRFWHDVYTQRTLIGEIYRARRAEVLRLIEELDFRPGSRAIDVGCGAGSITAALAEQGIQVDAVDSVPEMQALTAATVHDHGVQGLVEVHSGDVHALPFPDATFDCALAVGVMEWMSSFTVPLAELYRVLHPGGWLIANIDNAYALHCLVDPRMCPPASILKRHACRWAEAVGLMKPVARSSRCSPRTFDRALCDAGFVKRRSRTTGFGPFTLLGSPVLPDRTAVLLHTALQRLADRGTPLIRHGGDAYLVVAQKTPAQSAECRIAQP